MSDWEYDFPYDRWPDPPPPKDNVVPFKGGTILPVPPENVLKGAIEAKLTEVMVIGDTPDGKLYLASSESYNPDLLWRLEVARAELMRRALE